jgi:hypothetical protein
MQLPGIADFEGFDFREIESRKAASDSLTTFALGSGSHESLVLSHPAV